MRENMKKSNCVNKNIQGIFFKLELNHDKLVIYFIINN